jgi:hypothetical protein
MTTTLIKRSSSWLKLAPLPHPHPPPLGPLNLYFILLLQAPSINVFVWCAAVAAAFVVARDCVFVCHVKQRDRQYSKTGKRHRHSLRDGNCNRCSAVSCGAGCVCFASLFARKSRAVEDPSDGKSWTTSPSHATPHTSHLTPHTSHLTPHASHITHHTSHITHHTSHITHHTSHITHHNSR